eukprot:981883-Prorocentrum_lima.AAC.1
MFDGAGIARVRIGDVLRHLSSTDALQTSYAIKIDETLAAATQRALRAPDTSPHMFSTQPTRTRRVADVR